MKLLRPRLLVGIILSVAVVESLAVGLILVDHGYRRASWQKAMELGVERPLSRRFELYDAIVRGDRQALAKVLNSGVETTGKDGFHVEPGNLLDHAARQGDVGILASLIEKRIETEAASPLSAAAAGGSDDAIIFLAELGFDLNVRPDPSWASSADVSPDTVWRQNRNPVWAAVLNGQPVSILTLSRLGAKLDIRDADDATALHVAAAIGRLDVIGALLRSGADPNVTDKHGRSPADWASKQGKAMAAALLRAWAGSNFSRRLTESAEARRMKRRSDHTPQSDGVAWQDPET
jgi:ankyrin repeat protein